MERNLRNGKNLLSTKTTEGTGLLEKILKYIWRKMLSRSVPSINTTQRGRSMYNIYQDSIKNVSQSLPMLITSILAHIESISLEMVVLGEILLKKSLIIWKGNLGSGWGFIDCLQILWIYVLNCFIFKVLFFQIQSFLVFPRIIRYTFVLSDNRLCYKFNIRFDGLITAELFGTHPRNLL